jgi:hypothetical protein
MERLSSYSGMSQEELRGVPLELLLPFIFSSYICSRDMSREQQLQIPPFPEELIANSPLRPPFSAYDR